jgi:hypothetical protein
MEKLPLFISKINDEIIRFSKWDFFFLRKEESFKVTKAFFYSYSRRISGRNFLFWYKTYVTHHPNCRSCFDDLPYLTFPFLGLTVWYLTSVSWWLSGSWISMSTVVGVASKQLAWGFSGTEAAGCLGSQGSEVTHCHFCCFLLVTGPADLRVGKQNLHSYRRSFH